MIPPSAVEEFKASLRGPLLRPGEAGYDEARKVWNGSIDKRPALIARCVGVSDAIRCVNFARANKVLVAVRGGGHNIGGNAVCDDGLVIDLSRMKGLRVDPTQHSGGTVSGKVLALSKKETQLSWPEIHGVLALKAFSVGPQKMIAVQGCGWGLSPKPAKEIESQMDRALESLAQVLSAAP